jgi:hypothetical protein
MLLATGKYTVLKGGYEHTMPLVAQISRELEEDKVLEGVRKSPDFILINKKHPHVDFIEVKYHKDRNSTYILEDTQEIHAFWPHAKLFVATREGFFLDTCSDIIKYHNIQPFSDHIVSSELQEDYLKILKKFLR